MSKLGLNRSGKPSKYMEPPDKRRKVDAPDPMWDDDFDVILTQANLNAIDQLASQHAGHDHAPAAESRTNGTTSRSPTAHPEDVSVAGPSIGTNERPNSRATISESNCVPTAKNSRFERKPSGTGVALRSSSFGPGSSSRTSSADDRKSSESDLAHPSKGVVTERKDAAMNSGVGGSETGDAVHSSAMTGSETISPALPGASAQVATVDVTRIVEECNYYKGEMNKLKESQYAKDGQIKILREKYDQSQTEMNRKNLEIVRMLNQKSDERSKKETDLEAENERLRTQLQFRQQEVVEIKNQLKRAEKLSADSSSASDSTRSPVVGSRVLPKSPNTSKSPIATTRRSGCGNFPSSQTFLAPNKLPLSHSAGELIGLAKTAVVTVRHQKMKLNLVQPNGHHSGSHFIGHVLHQQLTTQCGSKIRDASTSGSTSSRQCSTRSSTQASQKADADLGFVSGISNQSLPKRNSTLEAALCLAHISLDALLSNDFPPTSIDVLPDETKSSALMLPLIEETLKKFAAFLQNQKKPPSSGSNGTLSGGRFCSWNSPESLGHSLGGLSIGSGNSQALEAADALFVLYQLVVRSEHVRSTLIGGTAEKFGEDVHRESKVMDAVVSLSLPKIERDCRLLDLLTFLANPVHTQNIHQGHSVPVLCLKILRILVQSSKEEHFTRFLPLLKSVCLFSCLNCDSNAEPNFFLAKHALELMSSAVHLQPVASGLCSFSDSCLLLSIVAFGSEQKLPASWTSPAITSVHRQMVSVLGVILRLHVLGARQLTSATCECSSKIVKGLLHAICEEYRTFVSSGSEVSMAVMRQGVSVLHLLAVHDKTFVTKSLDIGSDNYVALIAIRKLFKSLTEVPDHEENEFLELLPFGGGYSDEEDMEGIETDRPAKDASPRTNGIRPSTSKDA